MAKSFIFLILALLLLLSTAESRSLSTTLGHVQQADDSRMPFSSPESSFNIDDECEGLDGEECLNRRSLAAHTDYIYTQENAAP